MKTVTFIKALVSGGLGFLAGILGGWDALIVTLLTLIIIDYATGLLRSAYNGKLKSDVGRKGIIKKVMIVLLVVAVNIAQGFLMQDVPLREIVIMFFVINELISVLENIGEVITLPSIVYKMIEVLKDKREDVIEDVVEKVTGGDK